MNWRAKALAHGILSRVSGGHHLTYLLQTRVTQTLPVSDAVLRRNVLFALEHLSAFRRHSSQRIEDAAFYEFGAGYDLSIPLFYSAAGVKHQLVVDIARLVRPRLVLDASERIRAFGPDGRYDRIADLARRASRTGLLPALTVVCGIDYRAPFDARATGLPAASIDYISCTNVLAQIPCAQLPAILAECRRILRPEGLMRVLIDYRDIYSYFDKRLSVYNFLRYSDTVWRLYNSASHYQNRLRHCDFRRLFQSAGFVVVADDPGYDENAPMQILRSIPLADKFKAYSYDELAPVRGTFLLSARSPGRPLMNGRSSPTTHGRGESPVGDQRRIELWR